MSELNQKESKGRGGARAGAGRPKGAKDRVTVSGILEALEQQTNGRSYEEILIEDFIAARYSGDSGLVHKYHNLLSNKFIANLTDIKVENIGDDSANKETAFLAAIQALSQNKKEININKSKDDDNGN